MAGVATIARQTIRESAVRLLGKRWRWLLPAALVGLAYLHIFSKLAMDWWNLPDYSHGFLVPLFSAYVLWARRKTIATAPRAPAWNGIALLGAGLLTLLLGAYAAELFLSRISFLFVAAGLVVSMAGWEVFRHTRAAIAALALAIPLPTIVMNQITLPLQLVCSRLAAAALPLFGVPVLREGNILALPAMNLEVAEACSGIRSLVSLFTLAIFLGYYLEKHPRRRVALALASLPIAILANVVRIVGTGLAVQYWDPDRAMGFFHDFSGWLLFLVSLLCLFGFRSLMAAFPVWRRP